MAQISKIWEINYKLNGYYYGFILYSKNEYEYETKMINKNSEMSCRYYMKHLMMVLSTTEFEQTNWPRDRFSQILMEVSCSERFCGR
jgi:hypothetical protein